MQKQVYLLSAFLMLSTFLAAQEMPSKKFGLGFQLGQYQNNFGLGLNVTSPYFAKKNIALRVRGNLMWNEVVLNGETTWSPYGNASLGVVAIAGEIGNFLRIYGEGGVILILPNSEFSTANLETGGYGLFGFEFFFDPHYNYFIELGGMGTGALADKVANKPIYSNGFLINVGFRANF